MEDSFRCAALGLALMMAIAVVSANASADSINGTASATVVAPVNVIDTAFIYSTSTLVSGLTGDLIVRLPGAGPFGEENSYLNSAASALLAGSINNCIPCGGSLAEYIRQRAADGMLNGDPVSSITLDDAGSSQPASGSINITVAYN